MGPRPAADTSPRQATPTCAPNRPGSAWAYQHHPAVGAQIARRQQGLDPPGDRRAWAAQPRLCGRFRRLAARKTAKNLAAAIARELAGFLWAEMTTA